MLNLHFVYWYSYKYVNELHASSIPAPVVSIPTPVATAINDILHLRMYESTFVRVASL